MKGFINVMEANNVTKTYKGKVSVRALDGLSLNVKEKEVFGLLGKNGSGKTTFIKISSTQLKRDSGELKIFGSDPETNPRDIKDRIALVPQEGLPMYHLTPREHIYFMMRLRGFSKEESKSKSTEIIEKFLMESFADRQCANLSGGQKQITLVAQAFATSPDLLYLDEPTLGLDPLTRRKVWEVIGDIKKSTTILLTTHYMDEAETLADRVAIIDKGKVIAIGSPAELIQNFEFKYKVRIMKGYKYPEFEKYQYKRVINDYLIIFAQKDEIEKITGIAVKNNLEAYVGPITLEDLFIQVVGEEYEEQ